MKKIILILIISLMLPAILSGDVTSGKFLNIVKGPVAGGVGEAFSAINGEAEAINYNPAGLSGIRTGIIGLSYMRCGLGFNYERLVYINPFKRITLGIDFIFLNISFNDGVYQGGILSNNKPFVSNLSGGFTFQMDIIRILSIGAHLKIINGNYNETSSVSFGADLGLLFLFNRDKDKHKINIGVNCNNLATRMNFENYKEKLPMTISAGLMYQPIEQLKILADYHFYLHDTIGSINLGTQILPEWYLSPLLGVVIKNKAIGFASGLGFSKKFKKTSLRVNYALNVLFNKIRSFNNIVGVEVDIPSIKIKPRERGPLKIVAAVLNYENTSGSENLNYLSRTIPETIGAVLGRSEKITVIEKGKVWDEMKNLGYKPEEYVPMKKLVKLGEKLKANAIVSGSFVNVGNVLRITSTIVDIKTGEIIVSDLAQGEIGPMMFEVMDNLSFKLQGHIEKMHEKMEAEQSGKTVSTEESADQK